MMNKKNIPFEDIAEFFLAKNEEKIYKTTLACLEKPLIEGALKKTRGNKIKTAKLLGINRNTLYSKIKKLNIEAEKFKYAK